MSCHHCLSRTTNFLLLCLIIIISINFISASPTNDESHRIVTDPFECSDANSYLYHVLSQSKSARSLNSDPNSDSNQNHRQIPQRAINGDHLKVCSQGFTCCTEEMESKLLGESKREFQKSVQDKIVGLSHTFESRTTKFDRKSE
jgi:hypothetical protein